MVEAYTWYNRYFSYRYLAIHSDLSLSLLPPPFPLSVDTRSIIVLLARQYQTARRCFPCTVMQARKRTGFCCSPFYDATDATEIVNEALGDRTRHGNPSM